MPKRKRPVEKPKDQFKRFVEVAREHGVEADDPQLDRAFRKLATSDQSSPHKGRPAK